MQIDTRRRRYRDPFAQRRWQSRQQHVRTCRCGDDLGTADGLGGLMDTVRSAVKTGNLLLAVAAAVASGERNEEKLTNLLFFALHPERNRRKLQKGEPGFKQLSQEWVDLRNRWVRPYLRAISGGSKPRPPRGASEKCRVTGKNCVSCGQCDACRRSIARAPSSNLVKIPRELHFGGSSKRRLDAEALEAFKSLFQASRAAGFRGGLLKIVSSYRSYDHQASLWRGRLLRILKQSGCGKSQLRCIARAIDRTSKALSSNPIPHERFVWQNRFLNEMSKGGCASACNPKSAMRKLRKGTAPPGRSPHQTGRAVDLWVGSDLSLSKAARQRKHPAYRWMVCNAPRFGFHPYPPEPWHWEYHPQGS